MDSKIAAPADVARFALAKLAELPALDCSCGKTRRAFNGIEGAPASVHLVDISSDSRVHYHRAMTEHYVVLEGRGFIELDGETFPLEPLDAVQIRPGCRHRARPVEGGSLRILNVAVPVFDPEDEWFD